MHGSEPSQQTELTSVMTTPGLGAVWKMATAHIAKARETAGWQITNTGIDNLHALPGGSPFS